MPRHTTIRMSPDLLRQATERAREDRQTFTQLIETAVRAHLRAKPKKRRKKIVLPVAGKRGKGSMTVEDYQRLIDHMYEEEVERHNRLITERP